MNDSKTKVPSYETPEVKVIEVTVEQGFAIFGYNNSISERGDGGNLEDSFDF